MAALLLAAVLAPATSRADHLEHFAVANWVGDALSDPQSGQFAACRIASAYHSGIIMIFSTDVTHVDGNRTLSFLDETWQLKPGSQYQLSYRIDDGSSVMATGVAYSTHSVKVSLPAGDQAWAPFREGRRLDLEAAGGTFSFALDGSATALLRLESCFRHWLPKAITAGTADSDPFSAPGSATAATPPKPGNAGAASSDPFAPAAPASTTPAPAPSSPGAATASGRDISNDDAMREAKLFIARLLTPAQRSTMDFLSDAELAKIPGTLDATWRDGAMIATVGVGPTTTARDIDIAMSDLAANGSFMGQCLGRSNLKVEPQPVSPAMAGAIFGRYLVTCDGAPPKVALRLTFVRRPAGGSYLIFLTNNGQASVAALGALDEQLLDAAARFVHGS